MSGNRIDKIGRLIQKELGDIFQKKSMEYFAGKMVTVTEVRPTPDLGNARVFLSVFPEKDKEEFMKHVKSLSSQIRYELGKRIKSQMKNIPELQFFLDDSLDHMENIDNLLKK